MGDIEDIIFLVESLDKCRLGKLEDPAKLEKIVRKLKLRSNIRWKNIKKALNDIAGIPRRDPSFKRLNLMTKISEILLLISIFFPLLFYIFLIFNQYYFINSYYFLIPAVIIINISYILRWYTATKITDIYRKNIDKLIRRGDVLKSEINKLILILKSRVKKKGISLHNIKMKLYNTDYDNIIVIKKPGKFSSKYTVSLS